MSRITLAQAAELLQQSERLIITGHEHADGDSLGSALALYEWLLKRGKDCRILIDEDILSLYRFLPLVEDIQRPAASERVDLLVVLDASDEQRIREIRKYVDAPILNIDHHVSNTGFADYLYLDTDAPATGQIILELLQFCAAAITPTMATNLYTAIATDCGFFRYANTRPVTLRYAAQLMEAGAKPHRISEALEMKPASDVQALAKVLQTLEMFAQGRIAAISIDQEIFNGLDNSEGFVNYPRQIEGVEVAVLFKFVGPGAARVSLRSRGLDVSKVAVQFGGGGHRRAAGCSVNGTPEQVKAAVVEAIMTLLTEAGRA